MVPWGGRIVLALVIFIVGRGIAKLIVRAVRGLLEKANLDPALASFLGNIA